jgi:Caspase domain
LRRSVTPAQTARKEAAQPKRKVAQVSEPKKLAVKLAKKTAQSKPPSGKTTLIKKEMARLEPEEQIAQAQPTETPIARQDRNIDPLAEAQQPVTTAKLSLEPPPAAVLPSLSAPPDKKALGRRVALVIGNSDYVAVPALKNPAMDARAIASTLKDLGFEKVTLKLDLDRQSTWSALAEFADEASRADWAVVYYAGHGIELDAQNYIIPVDAKLDSDRKILFETVPLDHVLEATAGARKFRLVILDACRNNPFLASMARVASSRSIGRGLTRVEPQGGVLVAYAAKAGEIALDGETGNSPFVTALIEQLKQPGVEVGFLFRRVRDSVLDLTNGTQEPYTYGSLPGREELYFKPPVN